jgi:phosphopantetheinyl transferase (holo-ACP synthase)
LDCYFAIFKNGDSKKHIFLFFSLFTNAQLDQFYRHWTCKEAFSKALGMGMSIDFPTITSEKSPLLSQLPAFATRDAQLKPQLWRIRRNLEEWMPDSLVQSMTFRVDLNYMAAVSVVSPTHHLLDPEFATVIFRSNNPSSGSSEVSQSAGMLQLSGMLSSNVRFITFEEIVQRFQ